MTTIKIACIALCLLCSTMLRASGGEEPKSDAHGEKKPDAHGKDAKGGKPGHEATKGAAAKDHSATEVAGSLGSNDHDYVHTWIPFPEIVGKSVGKETLARYVPQPGRLTVVVFTASWCGPCQKVMDDLLRLEEKYTPLFTNFIYVYAHDTAQDAAGAVEEFGVNRAFLANHQILSDFHNPVAPTVYVADRTGWIQARYPRIDPKKGEKKKDAGRLDTKDIEELDHYLRVANSY